MVEGEIRLACETIAALFFLTRLTSPPGSGHRHTENSSCSRFSSVRLQVFAGGFLPGVRPSKISFQ